MQKKLVKHGNSLALVIDKPILELMGADIDTTFDITLNGRSLTLNPNADSENEQIFEEALDWASKKYAKAMKKLAE